MISSGDAGGTARVENATSADTATHVPAHDVLHAIPGRVRCRVPEVRRDEAYARRLEALGDSGAVTGSLRVNRAAASVVLRGDAGVPRERIREELGWALALAAESGSSPASPADLEKRRLRLLLPGSVAVAAALGRVLGFALPTPLGALGVLVAARPIARRAYHSLLVERRLNIDVLDMTAIVLTTLRGSFLAPASMIGLVEIGEAIRERTARASERELLDLLDSIAEVAWVERAGERRQVPVGEVRRGETVVVYPGDRVPVDGRVIDGTALIDEQQLTGEPMPVLREEGQVVYASTLMREGHLHIAVEQTGAETRAGRIVRLMQDVPIHDTRIENYAGRVADRIVLPSLLLASAVLAITRDPTRAASILITDFATGIRVSVPTTVLAAMGHAAQHGVVIRSGRALEQLAGIDAVVFDKTGTITAGQPVLTSVRSVRDDIADREVLALATTAEQRLTHPVAEAVVAYANAHGVRPRRRRRWHYDIGLGVRAEIDGRTMLVGSDRLMEREGVQLPVDHARGGADDSLIYVAGDGALLGVMTYTDPIRTGASEAIGVLSRDFGVQIHLLTGDKAARANAVGRDLGLPADHVHGELFPEEKATVVRQLRADGRRVAFVGDGINDLPALAYADVSVSFGGATDVARETADVVLMDDDLRGLTTAFGVAHRSLRLIRQNIGIVGGFNLGAIAMTTTVGLPPVAASVVHNGSTVVAAVNGLRPLLDGGARPRTHRSTAQPTPLETEDGPRHA